MKGVRDPGDLALGRGTVGDVHWGASGQWLGTRRVEKGVRFLKYVFYVSTVSGGQDLVERETIQVLVSHE